MYQIGRGLLLYANADGRIAQTALDLMRPLPIRDSCPKSWDDWGCSQIGDRWRCHRQFHGLFHLVSYCWDRLLTTLPFHI